MGFRPLHQSKYYGQVNKPVLPVGSLILSPPSIITHHQQFRAAIGDNGEIYSVAGWEWRECWVGTGEEVGWREVQVHRLCSRV